MSLKLEIEENEVDMLFAALRKLPMEHVEMLVYKLRVQVMQQSQAAPAGTVVNEDINTPADPADVVDSRE